MHRPFCHHIHVRVVFQTAIDHGSLDWLFLLTLSEVASGRKTVVFFGVSQLPVSSYGGEVFDANAVELAVGSEEDAFLVFHQIEHGLPYRFCKLIRGIYVFCHDGPDFLFVSQQHNLWRFHLGCEHIGEVADFLLFVDIANELHGRVAGLESFLHIFPFDFQVAGVVAKLLRQR